MEQLNTGVGARGGVPRRTIVKGAAWSVPVIAAAMAVPMASASGEGITGTSPIPSGACSPVGDFTVSVTTNGSATAGALVSVTLPSGLSWAGGASNPKTFITDASGTATITGVVGPSKPGTYVVVASAGSGTTLVSTTIPVFVQGTWIVTGPGTSGAPLHAVYTNPSDTGNLGTATCFAYCIEHNVKGPNGKVGYVGAVGSFLGSNNFRNGVTTTNYLLGTGPTALTAAQVQAKVEWIMRHSYPSVSLAQLEAATGQTGLTEAWAIEAAQYAIWSYTDLTFVDANWAFADGSPSNQTANFLKYKAVFTYLANGAWNDTAAAPSSCLKVLSSASADCATPTGASHLQSLAMVCDCA